MSIFPDYKIRVTFDTVMNIGLLPNKANFSMVFDGVPWEPTAMAWVDNMRLDVWLTFGPNPVVGVFHQLNVDNNCRSALGAHSWAPQEIQWKP